MNTNKAYSELDGIMNCINGLNANINVNIA